MLYQNFITNSLANLTKKMLLTKKSDINNLVFETK